MDIDLDSNSTYTFELSAKAVSDLAGNVTADTVTFNVTTGVFEATPETPTDSLVFGATPVVVTDNNVFTVEYAKDVTATTTNPANYTIGGKELPAGTQLQFVDGTKKYDSLYQKVLSLLMVIMYLKLKCSRYKR